MGSPTIVNGLDSARGCLRGARFFFDRFEAALRWPAGMFWRSGLRGGRLWLQYCATFLNLPATNRADPTAAARSVTFSPPTLIAGIVVIAVYCVAAALSGQGISRQCYIAALAVFLWLSASGIGRTWIDSRQNVPEEGVCCE